MWVLPLLHQSWQFTSDFMRCTLLNSTGIFPITPQWDLCLWGLEGVKTKEEEAGSHSKGGGKISGSTGERSTHTAHNSSTSPHYFQRNRIYNMVMSCGPSQNRMTSAPTAYNNPSSLHTTSSLVLRQSHTPRTRLVSRYKQKTAGNLAITSKGRFQGSRSGWVNLNGNFYCDMRQRTVSASGAL